MADTDTNDVAQLENMMAKYEAEEAALRAEEEALLSEEQMLMELDENPEFINELNPEFFGLQDDTEAAALNELIQERGKNTPEGAHLQEQMQAKVKPTCTKGEGKFKKRKR